MEGSIDVGKLAVAAIIFAILVAAAVGILVIGRSALNSGTEDLSESMSTLQQMSYTQYQDRNVTGTDVMGLIKDYWKDGNTSGILVSTKDGTNVLYDFSGTVGKDGQLDTVLTFTGYPTRDAVGTTIGEETGKAKADWVSAMKVANYEQQSDAIKDTIYSAAKGYECYDMSKAGYINKNAAFKGTVLFDKNNSPRCLMFVQQS